MNAPQQLRQMTPQEAWNIITFILESSYVKDVRIGDMRTSITSLEQACGIINSIINPPPAPAAKPEPQSQQEDVKKNTKKETVK